MGPTQGVLRNSPLVDNLSFRCSIFENCWVKRLLAKSYFPLLCRKYDINQIYNYMYIDIIPVVASFSHFVVRSNISFKEIT